MIRKLLKQVLIIMAVFAVGFEFLQLGFVQKGVIKTVVRLYSTYKIATIQIKKTGRFPFAINLPELVLSDTTNVVATLKNVSLKIPNFALNKITLKVENVITPSNSQPTGLDFTKPSPVGIASTLHDLTNYLQRFESIEINQLKFGQKTISLNLKRVDQVTTINLCHNDQKLSLNLKDLSDRTRLQANGWWLDHKITMFAEMQKNIIDFTAQCDLGFFVKLLSESYIPTSVTSIDLFNWLKLDNEIKSSEAHITGRLVKDPDWQLKPFKVITSGGHTFEGECSVKDNNHIKLCAQLQADTTNTANVDLEIRLNPFEISGSSTIAITDLEKFLPSLKGDFHLQALLTKVRDFKKGKLRLHGQGTAYNDDFNIPINLDIDLDNGLGKGSLHITKGHYQNYPLESEVEFSTTATNIQLAKLKLQLQQLQIILLNSATYDWCNGLNHAVMSFCGGTIELNDLKLTSPKESTAKIKLHNVQLGGLKILFAQEEDVTGLLNGRLQKLPQLPWTWKLNITNGVWQNHHNHRVYKILNNLSGNFEGSFDQNTARWKLSVNEPHKVNLASEGSADIANLTVDGTLKGLMHLDPLTNWLGTGDRIFGDVSVDLHGEGPLFSPTLHGSVNLDRGLYEHEEVGTFYQNITIRSSIQGKRLIITQFDAKDATNSSDPTHGKLTGEGWIDFSQLFAPVFHVPVQLNHLRIAQNDGFVGNANGKVLITGTGKDVGCQGEVTMENAEFVISENQEKMIPSIVNKKAISKNALSQNTGTIFPLDILVHIPEGAFKVIGNGMDSVWSGDIYVKKSIINPFLVGTVTLNKGTLAVFGKVLKITHGSTTFVDNDRNNPRIDLKAIKDLGDGIVIAIEVKGDGVNPIIDFTSQPSMAKEEVLSLLIFGKKLGEVSVLQSIQLAEFTKSNQTGNKGGFFEKIRSSFGFDQIDFKTSTKGGTAANDADATPAERAAGQTTQAIRIGKEFGKIQVGIEQGARSETSKLVVSTPLGHNLALQGDVGGAQNSGVGVSWIKRY